MEGQNLVLGRQLQLLGLELEQRSINFKLAMAGFTAPGDTPEARQARIDQAKKEADYAQRQLDIQKKMSGNAYKINTIQAQRSIGDLVAQVDELTRGRALAIETKAAQDAVTALSQEQQLLMADAKTWMDQGLSFVAQINAEMTAIETKTGKVVSSFSDDLVKAFSDAGAAMGKAVQSAMTGGGTIATTGSTPASQHDHGTSGINEPKPKAKKNEGARASGMLGTYSSPTQATFGEAGTETVAILRNPRSGSLPSGGGGGGGGSFTFNINISGGGSDLDQKKLAVWASQIKRDVEQTLNRKTSLLGLRNP
jgi:hypothetical protein